MNDCSPPKHVAHVKGVGEHLQWHDLDEHLGRVSALAADFSAAFGASPWAALAGLWHDLGKFRSGFQRYIRQCADPDSHIEGRVTGPEKTHSAAGALWAQQYLKEVQGRSGEVVARVLSYLIAGHHAGLADWAGENASLHNRFAQREAAEELNSTLTADIPPAILKPASELPDVGDLMRCRDDEIPGRFALWVRMLFSCLVDADFLDTEAFMSPDKTDVRKGFLDLTTMEARLAERLEQMAQAVAEQGEADSAVNRKRAEVLRACLAKAGLPAGVFSLTVPTGGGKTLSSLAFALRHAVLQERNDKRPVKPKRRIIYAIPYTSIIEQTADIFRGIFGDKNVIEHHSNVEADERQETHRSRLACENWDAPLIVTTNVQLLESLFASRTSRCRKLHNLVGSVIVLDEAQLLPVSYLQPVVDVLRLLVKDYGVTLVLCTATQPTLESRTGFDQAKALRGFKVGEVREIVVDVPGLYAHLDERVRVHPPADLNTPRTWDDLAPEIAAHEAVLAIVGRRADARDLYRQLKAESSEGLWHLSGLMCAQHRSDVIATIKEALGVRRQALRDGRATEPIRVVSTQLVEAGVDIDFPVVYRALAGLDSIAQAAGRCNREGRLERGEVHVFVPPKAPPPGLLRMAEQATRILWAALPAGAGPIGVERFAEFFRGLYGDARLDEKDICRLLRVGHEGDVMFRTAAERFRLIDQQDGATVFVRYRRFENDDEIGMWLNTLKKNGPDRWLLRKLQRYGVTIYRNDLQRLLAQGDIEALGGDFPGLYVQSANNDTLYDKVLGINVDGAPGDPSELIQ